MRTMRFAAVMASALALSTPATAGFFDFTLAPYVGASLGMATQDTCVAGIPTAGTTCDDSDTAWKIYGGMEMNEYISMEVGYADLGTFEYSGAKSGTREVNGMIMHMLGTYSPSPSFTLIASGGLNILNAEVNGTIAGASGNVGDTDVAWSFGMGAQYNFTKALGLRMEWERYFEVGGTDVGGTGEADIDLISAGVVYKF